MERAAGQGWRWRNQPRAVLSWFHLTECHWQRRQSAQTKVVAPDNRTGRELHICRAANERFKSELTFDARQRSAEAEVTCPTKSKMTIVGAR